MRYKKDSAKKDKKEGGRIRAVVTEGRFSALGNGHLFRELLSVKHLPRSLSFLCILDNMYYTFFVVVFHAWQTTLAHHNYRLVFSSSDGPRPVLETGTPPVAPAV